MSNIIPKAPKPPAYVPPPQPATTADLSDPTISRSAQFAYRAGADSYIGGKLNRKSNTAKAELTGG